MSGIYTLQPSSLAGTFFLAGTGLGSGSLQVLLFLVPGASVGFRVQMLSTGPAP